MEEKKEEKLLSPKVDESLYSRQLYVMGSEAMKRMLKSHVLLINLRKTGLEISKNLCLAGIRSISLLDQEKISAEDLSTAFYCTSADVGDRADKSMEYKIKSLNQQVSVKVLDALPESFSSFSAVVLCDSTKEEQIKINGMCRRDKVPFISARVKGLFFQIFCDFGETWISTDETGEDLFMGSIRNVSSSGEVEMVTEERHNMEDGDQIETKEDIPRRYKVKDTKAFRFSLEGYRGEQLQGVTFEQIRKQSILHFKTLEESLSSPSILNIEEHSETIHKCFTEVDEIEKNFDNASEKGNNEKILEQKVEEYLNKHTTKESDIFVVEEFFRQPWLSISPIVSVAGGIAAHEVLKACSSKFRPLQQFMYYHALEVLPPSIYKIRAKDRTIKQEEKQGRYASLYRIFGEETEKIFKMGAFIIGAGAIGCEHLKNLAMIGAGKNGKLIVTDMDAIERSNLNRQFLFREEDISHMKSTIAAREASVLNPDISPSISAYTSKVGAETEYLFNDHFYSSIDILLNALDNIDARLYMDSIALYQGIPMIDSGTLGTKGHTQTVVPHKTEHYGGSDDPQESSIPLCTIRNFPYLPVHCVEWALSEFKNLFSERITEAKGAIEELNHQELSEQAIKTLNSLPCSPEESIISAIKLFHHRFTYIPETLLQAFPPNHITEEGTPFWVPPKKMPIPSILSLDNENHLLFIQSAHKLLSATNSVLYKEFSKEEITKHIPQALEEAKQEEQALEKKEDVHFKKNTSSYNLKEEEFEKDSETNGHIDFICSAANIRSTIYSISTIPPLEAKKIAGRIIPAIATTTAVVSGLAVLEGIKYLFWKNEAKLEDIYKNNYVSLAMPFLGSSDPAPPGKITTTLAGNTITITQWDRIELQDAPLQDILNALKAKWNTEIPTLMHKLTMLYCSFYSQARFNKNLPKRISELIYPEGVPQGVLSTRLDAVIDDEEGNEMQVPFIKIIF
ncbi:ubiquitin-activating enzyme E1 [Nematocida sp. LUAm1]|nr:ubiquitin-activating enzyme E1 [Nematocida sp. LUAm2]KAI5178544.1 ubiquitin-activating enzyme E1 [Nematocida sp. LUAm1]